MQSATLSPARKHGRTRKHNLLGSITLSTALLCLTLPNAFSATNHLTLSGNFIPAQVGIKYSVPLAASGGTAPYTFAVSWGQLPAGLSLGATTGIISGTPSATGTSNFGIHVTDSKSAGGSQKFLITVSAAIAVTVTPSTATVQSPGTIAFTSTVTNSSNQTVTWTATLGTISATGLYQSPTVNSTS